MEQYKGHVILVMAPTGSGKGTLERHAFTTFSELKFAVSCTSRAIRPSELEGREYYFVTREQFEAKKNDGDFLEWAEFGGNLYGTLKSELLAPLVHGDVIINEIEIQGIDQIKEIIPRENYTIIYIDAGDWEAMERRAKGRAPMSEEEMNLRKQRYEHEVAAKPFADIVIDNRDGKLEDAKKAFIEAIETIFKQVH